MNKKTQRYFEIDDEAMEAFGRYLSGVHRSNIDKGQIDNQPIANLQPHYTNMYFKEARTVWLLFGQKLDKAYPEHVPGAVYNYSDRIWQWDWNKADEASKAVDESIDRRSPAFIQEFLRLYFENPNLRLVHIMAGFNVSNGYPYQVYGYFE